MKIPISKGSKGCGYDVSDQQWEAWMDPSLSWATTGRGTWGGFHYLGVGKAAGPDPSQGLIQCELFRVCVA